jgi:uncharacterized protein YndB with AHSA1/START domain
MASPPAVRAEVVVDATPEEAFEIFTGEIGIWWRRDTPYWNDPERALSVRLEPGVGGRFLEVHDIDAGTGFEVGRVSAWEPGERVAFSWTQVGWPEDVSTDVEITFEPVADGTRVRVEHTGFDRLGADAAGFHAGYASGWRALLGWFAERVSNPSSKGAA